MQARLTRKESGVDAEIGLEIFDDCEGNLLVLFRLLLDVANFLSYRL
jgi:hypothetical protein